MRKRIQKLASGKYEQREGIPVFSCDRIELTVTEGREYAGEFTITACGPTPLKGLVYSTNPYMECLTPQFQGEEVTIRYQFHSEGLVEGDIQKGEFSIICNLGEYDLSFAVSVNGQYPDTSIGKVRTLSQFARLAEKDYMEAFRLFTSAGFPHLIAQEEKTERLYYEVFSMPPVSVNNMEEFLVTLHKKESVRFEALQNAYIFEHLSKDQKETVSLRKNHWGFLEIEVVSDADFLCPLKSRITSEDFVGSVCRAEYLIKKDKLHAGKNYGTLVFRNAYQSVEIQVVASADCFTEERKRCHKEKQRTFSELVRLYLDYRLQKIGGALWASESVRHLNHLLGLEPENRWYKLWKAQAYLVSKQRQEAEWILDEYRQSAARKDTPEYGYYLYLCTLYEREPSYVNKLAAQIEELFVKQDESNILFWILLFVKEEYCNNSAARLAAIERRMEDGNRSPYLYLEACAIYRKNPYLLTRLTGFEIRVLHWAWKKDVLTQELAMDLAGLAGSVRVYQPLFYELLCGCYEKYERPELLAAICSYLIRTQRFGADCHRWYALGIEADVRIAGLNEAYLMSMELTEKSSLPKMVQLYFKYNPKLPYKQKAALLVRVIAAKKTEPETYESYRGIMEAFALEQILEGHMDDNLAIIYGELLERGMIQPEMTAPLAKILYTHKLTVSSDIAKVYVIHRQLKELQVVPVIHGAAYFRLYTRDYAIVFEDSHGRRYAAGLSYQLERLLNPGQYLRRCLKYAPSEEAFLLHYFAGREKSTMFMPEEKDYLLALLESDRLRDSYKAALYPEIIRYLERMDDHEAAEEYVRRVPLQLCTPQARIYVVEELITYHEYELAYAYVSQYGVAYIEPAKLVPLCSYKIEEYELEEDELLIELASYVFLNGKYNNQVLCYLAKYYGGTTRDLKKLWRACYAFEIESGELEERLLVQMLYTEEYVDDMEEIYASYCRHGGLSMLKEAYLSYFSYIYFVKRMLVPAQVFSEVMQYIYDGKQLPEVCSLALLQFFAEENDWTKEKTQVAIGILKDYVYRGMYFSFYRSFPVQIQEYFQFYDKTILEYRSKSSNRILLHARTDSQEEYTTEELHEVFDGIYGKAFTIFYGETIQYYITEQTLQGRQAVESGMLAWEGNAQECGASRYGRLNGLLYAKQQNNDEKLQRLMLSYERQERMNEKLFHMLPY